LGAHSAHALSGGAFAGVGFTLEDENVATSGCREVVSNAGADDAASDE